MSKRSFVFLALAFSIVLFLAVRVGIKGFQSADETSEWQFTFSEVRAYRMNWSNEFALMGSIYEGNLNETMLPQDGVLLTEAQVETLRGAVLTQKPEYTTGMCHYPHHAFLFFGDEGQIVGHYDVCFLCSSVGYAPNGFADSVDYKSLERLVLNLGLPLRNSEWVEQVVPPKYDRAGG